MTQKFSILLAVLLIFSDRAWSAVLIEPTFAIQSGTMTGSLTATNSDIGGKTSGSALGARFGYKLPAFVWLALDASTISNGKYSGSVSGNDGKFSATDVFIDLGVDLPFWFRFWVGLGVYNKSEIVRDVGGASTKYSDGSNSKMGLGFTGIPFLSLNVEYSLLKPKKVDLGLSGSGDVSTLLQKYDENRLMVGISVPFSF